MTQGSAAPHLLLSHADQAADSGRDRRAPPQAPPRCQPLHRRAPRLRPDRAHRLLGDDAQTQEGAGHGEPEGKDAALEGSQQGEGVEPRGPGVRKRLQPDEWKGGEHQSGCEGAPDGIILPGGGSERRRWNFERHFPWIHRELALHPCPCGQLCPCRLYHARPFSNVHQRLFSLLKERQLHMTQASFKSGQVLKTLLFEIY